MADHITLDRDNLQALVDLLRENGQAHAMPDQMRVGYDMAVEIMQRLVPESPHLYGPDGCPDIPALIAQVEAADAVTDRVTALRNQWARLAGQANKAMCQGCHLHYDRNHHAETRAATRRAKTAGLADLFDSDDTRELG